MMKLEWAHNPCEHLLQWLAYHHYRATTLMAATPHHYETAPKCTNECG